MSSLERCLKVSSEEQIRRSGRAKLNGIALLVCRGWHLECSKVLMFVGGFGVNVSSDIAVIYKNVNIKKGYRCKHVN